jgi:thiol-disulfide isomerase/thioredoxin
MKSITQLTGIALLCLIMTNVIAQSTATKEIIQVGKPIPEFVLTEITHFEKSFASNKDFQGKWLFIDFWFSGCAACILSFPKVSELQKEFKSELNWVLVGLTNARYGDSRKLYEKLRVKRGLDMPAAYDSLLARIWGVPSYPHIIMIDPTGIVRHVTSGRDITKEKIQALITGQPVKFYSKDENQTPFVAPPIIGTSASVSTNSLLYQSAITKWNGEKQSTGYEIDRFIDYKIYQEEELYKLAMVPLYAMYNYAYIGKWNWDFTNTKYHGIYYPLPILELADTTLFDHDFTNQVGKGTYNYALKLPPSEITKERLMTCMQQDLKRAFNYSASLEERDIPVLKLTATPEAKANLKTKGGKRFLPRESSAAGITMRNVEPYHLEGLLGFYLNYEKVIIINETGVTGNIDFSIDADMTNLNDMTRELQKQGLTLTKGTKKMKVVVIRDSDKL